MINYLTNKEEKDELFKTFKSLDKNNDGMLSREELLQGNIFTIIFLMQYIIKYILIWITHIYNYIYIFINKFIYLKFI